MAWLEREMDEEEEENEKTTEEGIKPGQRRGDGKEKKEVIYCRTKGQKQVKHKKIKAKDKYKGLSR